MGNFVLLHDLNTIATEEDLNVITSQNLPLINQTTEMAIDEASAYLRVKYDLDRLFQAPELYSTGDTYTIHDRIYTSGTEITHYTCIATGATSGTPITDTTFFKVKDSRDNKLLEVIMSISLFYLHKRLSPNNIPFHRVMAYDGNGDTNIMSAIKWLGIVQDGSIELEWPKGGEDTCIDIDNDGIPDYCMEGANPALGILWGNSMGQDYFHYNGLVDPNLITYTGQTS